MWSALVFLAGMIFLRMASKDMNKKAAERRRQSKNRVVRNTSRNAGRSIPSRQRTGHSQRPNSFRYTQPRRPVRQEPAIRSSIQHQVRPVRTVLSA